MRVIYKNTERVRRAVAVLSNTIYPLWYLEMVYSSKQYPFLLNNAGVEIDLDKGFAKCKELGRLPLETIFWIIDIEPLIMVESSKGHSRDDVIIRLQGVIEDLSGLTNVKVIINNPSFELWLQLHFDTLSIAFQTTVERVENRIKECIPGYCKELQFYKGDNIFNKTQANLGAAKIHAASLMEPDFPDLKMARTMMPLVLDMFA